jgi:hypothetical protein
MASRILCRNGYIVASELPSGGAIDPQSGLTLFGRDRADRVSTSTTCHEMVVDAVAPDVAGIKPGDHVIVFLGGDDGGVSANGISAFVKLDALERAVVHERFVWAVVRDGVVYPLGRVVLTKRNDEAFRRHVLGASSLLHLPEAQQKHGQRATGPDDDSNNVLASVTALYETVSRVGAGVRSGVGIKPGETVCFSPSFSSALLRVGRDWFHLVDSEEIFFAVE